MDAHLRVRVRAEGRVLTFVDPCPYCSERHVHGGWLDENGTYGTRSIHCSDHTHETTASGRRKSLYARGVVPCSINHPAYLLVPE